MLDFLKLKYVGPAPELELNLARRINVITGDNGLGKSFLLDIAWWALTRTWAGPMAWPSKKRKSAATIEFSFDARSKTNRYESRFDRLSQSWSGKLGRPPNPGLVLYAQADGSFSVWDPSRNYWKRRGNADVQDRPPAYLFDSRSIWNGLTNNGNSICNGLIQDWASWQKEKSEAFAQLKAALRAVSAGESEPLVPGELTRISLDDVRDIPTLRMPYGEDVPITFSSAGVKRIAALVYLLVWCWQEHMRASQLLGLKPTRQIIFLIDELEAHLHPRWQRVILNSLMAAVRELTGKSKLDVQIVTATHSPLVLASLETLFDENRDAWFDLDLEHPSTGKPSEVKLRKREWMKHGDVSNWLTSEAFDLQHARSVEAEQALEEASHALKNEGISKVEARKIDAKLREVLSDIDPYWMRWRYIGEKRGWLK